MSVTEIINKHQRERQFSFEVLPPLKGTGTDRLFADIDRLAELEPAFINITTHHSEYVYRELPEGEDEELEDDIHLDDFKDEIDEWVIEELKKNGWSTARSVLEAPREMLVQKADLEEETVDEILRILRQEFADDEEESASPEES